MKIYAFLLFLLFSGVTHGEDSRTSICGPRCLQQVLRFYGNNDTDLLDIVAIAQPELDKGMSLRHGIDFLSKEGMHSTAIRVDESAIDRIDWRWPILVHGITTRGPHYCLRMPTADEASRHFVWDQDQMADSIYDVMDPSGVILLTSPVELDETQVASIQVEGAFRKTRVMLVAIGFLGVWLLVRRVVRRRTDT